MQNEQFRDTATAILRALRNADGEVHTDSPDAEAIGSLIVANTMTVQLCEGLLARVNAIEASAATAAQAVLAVSSNGDGPHPINPPGTI